MKNHPRTIERLGGDLTSEYYFEIYLTMNSVIPSSVIPPLK